MATDGVWQSIERVDASRSLAFLPARFHFDSLLLPVSEQRHQPAAVALEPAGKLELQQHRAHDGGRGA